MYKGYFREGKKHGHGLLTQGSLVQSSVASLYIGEWVADKKHGYGVFDDVSKGKILLLLYLSFRLQSLFFYYT